MTPIRPPFTHESALAKVQAAEDAWNSRHGQWYRSYGNEMWEFAADRLMARRYASINDAPIRTSERCLFSPERPPATAEVSP
jgi:nuclear transport factor 2 (NTF2) superfamily protein